MTYNPARDGYDSYNLAIACMREISIRKGQIKPSPDRPDELRWAREGYAGIKGLETSKLPPGVEGRVPA